MLKVIVLILLNVLVLFASGLDTGVYRATGYSAPGQSKYAAMAAAKVDAQRSLLEQIYETKVTSTTSLSNNKAQVKTAVSGVLKGARTVSRKYNAQRGEAEVVMEVDTARIIKTLKKKKVLKISFFQNLKTKEEQPKMVKEVPIEYDSLILDARDTDVEAAIYNRVFVGDKLFFDPMALEDDLAVDDGMTFTAYDIQTSKSYLMSYGSTNPMIVKAVGSRSENKGDILISINDANKILQDNQKNNYLKKCRVVFMLGKKSK